MTKKELIRALRQYERAAFRRIAILIGMATVAPVCGVIISECDPPYVTIIGALACVSFISILPVSIVLRRRLPILECPGCSFRLKDTLGKIAVATGNCGNCGYRLTDRKGEQSPGE